MFSIESLLIVMLLAGEPSPPQDTTRAETRAAALELTQAEKAVALHPFAPGKVEQVMNRVEQILMTGGLHVHPFFESAYSGGGFTLGAGYLQRVSSYNLVDVRGSITFSGYKRIEAAFVAPRFLSRRASLNLLGGWREATQVGFYGVGSANTSADDRADYSFQQPYGSAVLDVWPARKLLLLRGSVELSTWNQRAGKGSVRSVDEVYTPATLQGLGSSPTYLHTQGTIALDTRPAAGYARRGTFLGVTFHDFHDTNSQFGFRRTDYEAIQHVPVGRDAWVLSLHGRLELANAAAGQVIPFYMLPALGGGSSLRGFASWRFRDRNALLLQAEWRVLANRYLDMALVYDAGRVADKRSDLTSPLKSDYGIGFRFHGPVMTPLRIEFVRGNEGLGIVFSSKAVF